jgi:hypothetical protein
MLADAPRMKRAPDKECAVEGADNGGHILGGASRLAVYGVPLVYKYLGCYRNEAGDRVSGHKSDTNFGECNALALQKHSPVFGMEWPQGPKEPGDAYCLLLAGHPSMKRAPDKECAGEGKDSGGHYLGGPHRLAVYGKPEPYHYLGCFKNSGACHTLQGASTCIARAVLACLVLACAHTSQSGLPE